MPERLSPSGAGTASTTRAAALPPISMDGSRPRRRARQLEGDEIGPPQEEGDAEEDASFRKLQDLPASPCCPTSKHANPSHLRRTEASYSHDALAFVVLDGDRGSPWHALSAGAARVSAVDVGHGPAPCTGRSTARGPKTSGGASAPGRRAARAA
jgi:hypothetical protein